MSKLIRSLSILMIVMCCAASLSSSRPAAAADAYGAGEFAVIRFIGNHNTRIAFPDGHIEYAETMLGGRDAPSNVEPRTFQTVLLLNQLAKQGYEYAGKFNNGEEIVMKKVR